jgi:hypothetical protein
MSGFWWEQGDYEPKDAYEPGDPKNPDYVDAVEDAGDNLRKLEKERGPLAPGDQVRTPDGPGEIVALHTQPDVVLRGEVVRGGRWFLVRFQEGHRRFYKPTELVRR